MILSKSNIAGFLFLLGCQIFFLYGGELRGRMLSHHFDYKTYRGHQENWSTTQDSLGRIYVANNSGILIFDGARWQLVRNPANAAVLSVDYAPDGRVYAGLESDFGYLESDSLGFPQYVSLKDRLPDSLRTFQQVWKVHALPNAVYFFTVKRVFRWDGSELSLFHNYSISALSNKVGNRIFFGDYGQGIMVVGEDSLYRLPGCEDFLREENFVVTGGGKPEELLLITRGRGIFRYHQGQFSTFPTPVGERLRKAAVYCGTTMPDGRLLLGTIRDGLLVLDQNGALLYHVNKDEGLKENTVVHAFVDAQNGIWLAEVNGITRLEPDAGMGTFGEAEGLKGNVLSLLGSSGGIYAGTHEGLFRLKEGPPGKRGEFDTVSGIRSFTHALSEQDGQILAGTDRGVFIVEGNQARFIDVAWPRVYGFHRGKAHPEQIYVALLNGLSIMRKNASGAWDHHRRVQGIEREIRAIGGDRDDRLWLAPAGGGLLRVSVRYPDNPSELLTAAIDTFGQAHNLPGGEVSIAEINGENLFITGNAILIFDEDRQQFAPHPLMEGAYRGKGHQLTAIQNNGDQLWIAGQERDEPFLDLINLADPAKKVRFQRLRDLGLISAVWAEANFLLLGAAEGIVLLYPDRVFKPADAFAVVLHQVRINDGEKVRGIGWGPPSAGLSLHFHQNRLRFEFSATSYDDAQANLFQTRLEGLDEDWSAWSPEIRKDFTSLPEGNYNFRVRSRNAHGTVSKATGFAFNVLPPWYRTAWAYGFYLLLGGGMLGLLVQLRVNSVRRKAEETLARERDRAELQEATLRAEAAEAQKEVEKEIMRSRIASDLHDEIGSNLSSISLLSQLLMKREDLTAKERERLNHIASVARETAHAMRDIVWFVNPANDSLSRLWARMRETANLMLEPYEFVFEAPETAVNIPQDLNFKRNLYLIFKEALQNIVRHADPKKVEIRIGETSGGFFMEIVDDGRGFNPQTAPAGNGLGNFARRARDMGAELEVASQPGKGTRVFLHQKYRDSGMDS